LGGLSSIKGPREHEANPVTAAANSTSRFERYFVARAVAATGLVAVSLILGIIIVELFCYFFFPSIGRASVSDANHRILFFDGDGTIFQNHGTIFTYVPHNEVRSVAVYFSDKDFIVAYDNQFHTNNYGLVQDFDVVPARPSLLILGDSFTEGQGATPWFRQLVMQTNNLEHQLINGGLLGTGFEQWNELEQYLSTKNVQIRKLLVIFISDDYNRAVWNFAPEVLDCLRSVSLCRSDKSLFVRLTPEPELAASINKIRTLRAAQATVKDRLTQLARSLLPASYRVYLYLNIKFSSNKRRSRAVIDDLIKKYGTENVAFLHLPQKDETNGPGQLGLEARQAIRDAGGTLIDGFKLCRLSAGDYHNHDSHPNERGYGKIAQCVHQVIEGMLGSG
jgi:cellulose biosynthesis protein BcsQ